MFEVVPENAKQVACGLADKLFKSVWSEAMSLNLTGTSKVTHQSDDIFLTGSGPLATLPISNFSTFHPQTPTPLLPPALSR